MNMPLFYISNIHLHIYIFSNPTLTINDIDPIYMYVITDSKYLIFMTNPFIQGAGFVEMEPSVSPSHLCVFNPVYFTMYRGRRVVDGRFRNEE